MEGGKGEVECEVREDEIEEGEGKVGEEYGVVGLGEGVVDEWGEKVGKGE